MSSEVCTCGPDPLPGCYRTCPQLDSGATASIFKILDTPKRKPKPVEEVADADRR